MNIFWSASSRVSCRSAMTFQECATIELYVSKVAHSPIRPFSILSSPFRRKCLHTKPISLTSLTATQAGTTKLQWHRATRTFASQRIITQYEDVPSEYKDEEGLDFRSMPLSEVEVQALFGRGIDPGLANKILKVIHGRRVAGTLADPALGFPALCHDERINKTALTWLRQRLPVDEQGAAGQRAELELETLEAEFLNDGERLGLYKPNLEGEMKPGQHDPKSVYGRSGLDAIREAKERQLDENERAEEEARQQQANEDPDKIGTLSTDTVKSRVELRRPGENSRLKYYLDRAKVLPDVPPEMSTWQRLGPSLLVVLCVIGGTVAFAQVYVPPSRSARIWPDVPPAAATVLTLIIANVLVYVAWRVPPAFRFLNKYFLSVPGYPRAMATLGNVFSHQSTSHLLINMSVLYFMGTQLHESVGRANFLAIYLSSGVVASFSSLASFAMRGHFVTSSLGASGAIAGVIAALLWLHLNDEFKILFIFPPDPYPGIPGYAILGFVILVEGIGLFRGWKVSTPIDHVAHMGGYATGIMGAEIMKRRMQQRRKLEYERRKNMSVTERIKSWR